MPKGKQPNLLFLGIDSLRADHMSMYGYRRLTTPYMDKLAQKGVVFEQHISPSIPTTSGYSVMLTGRDMFSTGVVALRHKGDMAPGNRTLAEILGESGYNTTCVGFDGNIASRGFQKYLSFSGWGSWAEGRSPKAENLNAVALPELRRLAAEDKPFFLFLRHMDPHAPYLPPQPYERMFYEGNEFDENNKSLDPVMTFKPFCDFFASWFPPRCTDKDYMIAQYDGEVAYMDACIQNIFTTLETLGQAENTLIVITSDHGETLYDHECYFDHHGIYETTLHVPMAYIMPGKVPAGVRVDKPSQHKDIVPTVLDLLGVKAKGCKFDGSTMQGAWDGTESYIPESEVYITECTWMRKHGWRTPEWKLIHALEPDFHFKPEIELYNRIQDPMELNNVAEQYPDVVAFLEARMQAHIAKRKQQTKRDNPIMTNEDWHGQGCGFFTSSQQAYDTLHIGDVGAAIRLQAKQKEE